MFRYTPSDQSISIQLIYPFSGFTSKKLLWSFDYEKNKNVEEKDKGIYCQMDDAILEMHKDAYKIE